MTDRITRRALGATLLAAVVGLLCVPAAGASPSIKIGLLDDHQTLYLRTTAFPEYDLLNVQVLRLTIRWDQVAPTAPTGIPSDPGPLSYDQNKWEPYDEAIKAAAAATSDGSQPIQVFLTIYGTPAWANGGHGSDPRWAPTSLQLQAFAHAAAKRYSGTYDDPTTPDDVDPFPQVLYWGAWNEPNLSTFLRPQWKKIGKRYVAIAPTQYARICNQVFNGVHGALTNTTAERVACGLTAPRGNNNPRAGSPAHTPLQFLRGMKRAGAKFDVYGHQPHSPRKAPTWKPGSLHHIALGNISYLVKELTRLYGKKRIWITEYGYESNPPDPLLGVSQSTQAKWMKQAFGIAKAHVRIDMFIWFLLIDEKRPGSTTAGWQSGLQFFGGDDKLAYATFNSLTP